TDEIEAAFQALLDERDTAPLRDERPVAVALEGVGAVDIPRLSGAGRERVDAVRSDDVALLLVEHLVGLEPEDSNHDTVLDAGRRLVDPSGFRGVVARVDARDDAGRRNDDRVALAEERA